MRVRIALLPAALAAYAVLLGGCHSEQREAPTEREPRLRGAIFVLIDALRADHLGAYGYTRPTSPQMDALAADGTLFENAVTTAPWTLPAMGSVWTGLYPTLHGATQRSNTDVMVRDPKRFRVTSILDPSSTTLAEVLKANDVQTAAFVDGVYPGSIFGFAQGFDVFIEEGTDGARMNVEAALAWLDTETPERFFIYIHLVDVHSPYTPPGIPGGLRQRTDQASVNRLKLLQEQRRRYTQFEFDRDYAGQVDGSLASLARLRGAHPAPAPRDVEHVVALYDRGIAYTDYWIGQLVSGLRQRQLYDATLLIVTADHGEEFFEHGALEHGVNLYDEVMKVPLIIRAPSEGRRVRVREQAGLLDMTPTILDFFGLAPPSGQQGISVRPAFAGTPLPDRLMFAEADQSGSVKAMRSTKFKFIRKGKRPELYDLRVDPQEKENLCPPSDRESCADFAQILRDWEDDMARVAATKPTPGEAVIDEGARERLRALGYLE